MEQQKPLNEQLWTTACEGDVPSVLKLIEKGANKDAKGWSGITPLIGAAAAGHIEVVKVLLNQGANPSLTDDRVFSAVEAATMNDYAQIAELIRLAGGQGETKNLLLQPGVLLRLLCHPALRRSEIQIRRTAGIPEIFNDI